MPKSSASFNFTKSLKRLEEIVEKLESSDVDLEESLKLLEEGVKLHRECERMLKGAQVKINEVLKTKRG